MKKIMKMLLLAAIFTLALSVSAFALDKDPGICNIKTYESGVTVTAETANGTTVATPNADGVYANTERVEVTFSGATATKYYLVVALDEGQYPTVGDDGENNVAYINQETASGSSVSFDVYPKSLVNGQTYTIYVSSNDGVNGYKKVASFDYFAPYLLGDVNLDGEVMVDDVLLLLNYLAENASLNETQKYVADVVVDNDVMVDDALKILNYLAENIDTLA